MPYFNYLAQDAKAQKTGGNIEAVDIIEAKAKIRQMGLYLVRVKQEARVFSILGSAKIKSMDLAVFSHQFAAMISSGVPLLRSLNALAEEATDKPFRFIIQKIKTDIENGQSLSSALSRNPKVFSNFFVSLIKTGELGGVLPVLLNRLANYLEKEEDLRRKVKSSFAYPVIVLITAILVVTFLLIFIVPVFCSVFKALKINLPMPTLALIALSNLVVKLWWLLLLLGVFAYVFLQVAVKKQAVRFFIDKLKLGIPIFWDA